MYFITFEKDGISRLGVMLSDQKKAVTLHALGFDERYTDMVDFISHVTEEELKKAQKNWELSVQREKLLEEAFDLEEIKLLSPITRPIHDILCVGINYRSHEEETEHLFDLSAKKPSQHIYFSKRACHITGPDEAIPSHPFVDEEMDYEAELAVIIGKEGRDIAPEDAEDYIFGYSVFNDVTARAVQKKHVQWLRGKSLDGYSVMGPAIVHKSQLPFPLELNISCHVNGELRQQSNTRLLIADIPTIISELSAGMTLEPGDIIATGTPAGVGMGFTPPIYLKRGDKVLCSIEGIGELCNIID